MPDTIQFMNGNQIVNVYDAAGRKLYSKTYTFLQQLAQPVTQVLQLEPAPRHIEQITTVYNGNVTSTNRFGELAGYGTPQIHTIYNTEGYVMRQIYLRSYRQEYDYYYYRRNHLGNNVAVWNATADSTEQRTFYYATGLPMSCSTEQSFQNRKYNGKEYVEDHGFDVYDYGFRGYYATIGRFTSIDPLAEQTPWQSPYVYANNNFVNNVDLWGLAAISFSQPPTYSCIFIDNNGVMLGGIDDGDYGIYLVEDENWTLADGKEGLQQVGWMISSFDFYITNFWQNGAFGWRAPGLYFGQNKISISSSFGINIEKSISVMGKSIDVGFNIMSFELLNLSYTLNQDLLDGDNWANSNWFGKDRKITITQGASFSPFAAYDHSFKVRTKDLEYIRGTEQNVFSNILTFLNKYTTNQEGYFSFSYSEGIFFSFAITITGNYYYYGKE